jgi:hypothetical protein
VTARHNIQLQVQTSLHDAQQRIAKAADRARREVHHEISECVWLATKHLPLRTGTRKLAAIWTGPFKIIDTVGPVAYRLHIPEEWNIHNFFHVSQLKRVMGDVQQEEALLIDSGEEFEVEKILDTRISRNQKQFLVK